MVDPDLEMDLRLKGGTLSESQLSRNAGAKMEEQLLHPGGREGRAALATRANDLFDTAQSASMFVSLVGAGTKQRRTPGTGNKQASTAARRMKPGRRSEL